MHLPRRTGVVRRCCYLEPRRGLSQSISGAILHIICVAAYGALLFFIAFLPLVSPGVIIVSPLRGLANYQSCPKHFTFNLPLVGRPFNIL